MSNKVKKVYEVTQIESQSWMKTRSIMKCSFVWIAKF